MRCAGYVFRDDEWDRRVVIGEGVIKGGSMKDPVRQSLIAGAISGTRDLSER
jgi:hypothetical protein